MEEKNKKHKSLQQSIFKSYADVYTDNKQYAEDIKLAKVNV